jgi:hypothetical protein
VYRKKNVTVRPSVRLPYRYIFRLLLLKHQTQLNERRRCSIYYYEENDLKLLGEMKALVPEEFTAWANLDGIVGRNCSTRQCIFWDL